MEDTYLKRGWRSHGDVVGLSGSHSPLQYSALTKIADLPIECSPSFSILDAAKLMSARRAHCIIVTDESSGKMTGLATAKDMAFRVVANEVDPMSPVTDIMTTTPYSVPCYTSANEALRLMVIRKIRHLPLTDESGIVVGLLNITKCFYHAMIRLEKMSEGARILQSTFEDLNEGAAVTYPTVNEDDESEDTDSAIVEAPIDPMVVNEQLFDLSIRQRKRRIAGDLKRLIDILKQPELRHLLEDEELHIGNCATVDPSTSIWEAAKLLKERNVTAALICQNSKVSSCSASDVIGILTTKDILFRVLASNYDPRTIKVARVMTPRPNFANESMGIHTALRLMYEGKYLNLPIVNNEGMVTGLVNVLHLTSALLKALDLTTVDSSSFPSRPPIIPPGYDSETNSVGNEETSGPAWNKFWGSLEEPLKSLGSSEKLSRRSSYNHSRVNLSELRSNSNFRSSSITSTMSIPLQQSSFAPTPHKRALKPSFSSSFNPTLNPKLNFTEMPDPKPSSKIIKFKLKVQESLGLNLDGKIYRVKVTVDVTSKDHDLLTVIKEKIYGKLELNRFSDCFFDLGYIDDDDDLIALDKNEDLEAALESNMKKMTLILKVKEKSLEGSTLLDGNFDVPSRSIGSIVVVATSAICGAFLLSRLWATTS
ncbi:DEKNAAC102962 [Brettanomyces naardenensis]|uniref:DEKNAAC102962 n=1 Tax=Brettanomyces naardenensis TaxID=13370 RepID=A0A448YM79_BRENA|nr:DEKNAAC102962 [Brettanomyces naardenensis]